MRCLRTYACACGAMSLAHPALLRREAPADTAQALCGCCVISAEEEYRTVGEEGRRQLRSGWRPVASPWSC